MIKFNTRTLDAEMVIGDTGTFSVTPTINGEKFLEEGDKVYFTLRKSQDRSILIQKEITDIEDGSVVISIESSETENLEHGNYIYDLKLVRADGTVDTLTPNPITHFNLKRGVK